MKIEFLGELNNFILKSQYNNSCRIKYLTVEGCSDEVV